MALEPRVRTIVRLVNRLEGEFAKVTPALLLQTAQEYLRPTNRTIETIVPGAK